MSFFSVSVVRRTACASMALLACASALPLAAQESALPPPAPRAARVAMDACEPALVADEQGFLAAGRAYKCRFDARGVEFTPALGERAPRNLPLRFALRDIRRGDAVLHVAQESVAPEARDAAVLYERGFVQERYDLRANEIEQSFVFRERIAGSGDLVVSLAFATELQASFEGRELRFTWPELGGVRIGAVLGIDAQGHKVEGSLHLAGDRLELVLPGAFVDAASYPLTLDPPIGGVFGVSLGGENATEPDVCFDLGTGYYLVAYVVRFSFPDSDIYARRFTYATGGVVGTQIVLESGPNLARRPRIGSSRALGRWVVAWEESIGPLYERNLYARTVVASSGATSAVSGLATGSLDEHHVALGGESSSIDDEVIAVWDSGAGISACRITPGTGAPTYSAVVPVAFGAGLENPTISKACSLAGIFTVAWDFAGTLSRDIALQGIDRNLTILGNSVVAGSSALDEQRPAVDGGMFVYERYSSSIPGSDRDILCRAFFPTASGVQLVGSAQILDGDSEDEHSPDVAILGTRHAVTYVESNGSLDDEAYLWLVNSDCTVCKSRITLDIPLGLTGYDREATPRLAGSTIYDSSLDHGLVAFAEGFIAPPFNSRLAALRVENDGPGIAPQDLGGGCGANAALTTEGRLILGNPAFRLSVIELRSGGLYYLAIGLPSNGLSCGPCTMTDPLFLFQVPWANGAHAISFPIPCSPEMNGAQIETQWLFFNTAQTPCRILPGLSMRNRLLWTVSE